MSRKIGARCFGATIIIVAREIDRSIERHFVVVVVVVVMGRFSGSASDCDPLFFPPSLVNQ